MSLTHTGSGRFDVWAPNVSAVTLLANGQQYHGRGIRSPDIEARGAAIHKGHAFSPSTGTSKATG